MHFSTVTLFSSILLAAQAVAILPRSPFVQLFSRQTTDDACTASCSTFKSALDDCATTACLCTTTVANGLNSCVNCYYTESPTQNELDAANKLITTYQSTCSGFSLPVISVKTSAGGATTAVVPVVTTTAKAVTTTNTPIVVTSVAVATTAAAPKVTVTAVTTGDATTTSSSSSSTASGNVIPGLTSGATLVQCQALVVPAAVVLGGFLTLM